MCPLASYANQGKYREAVVEFKRALGLDSEHANAKSYLSATEQKVLLVMFHQLVV